LFLIVSKVTIQNKRSKYQAPQLMNTWTRLIKDCRTLSKVPTDWAWFHRHKKCVG